MVWIGQDDYFFIMNIKGEEKLADRNIKLLQHLEELGNPAVELFINALRQSGQLHLASTLDVEHRIKPVHGKGEVSLNKYTVYNKYCLSLLINNVFIFMHTDQMIGGWGWEAY